MEKMLSLPGSTDLKMALFSSGSHKLPSYSSSIVSFPVCTILSVRSFAKRREVNWTSLSPASPQLRATQDLIKGLESEITTLQRDLERFHAVKDSDEFPFEIVTHLGYGLKTTETELIRELEDEIIGVSVDYDTDEEEDYEDDEEDEDEEEDCGIPLKVSIFQKTTGQQLELDVITFPDEICVDNFSIRKPKHSDRDSIKTGGEYLDNLLKELVKYLEVKGITPNTIELWKVSLKNKKSSLPGEYERVQGFYGTKHRYANSSKTLWFWC